jgi:hypothetical protein
VTCQRSRRFHFPALGDDGSFPITHPAKSKYNYTIYASGSLPTLMPVNFTDPTPQSLIPATALGFDGTEATYLEIPELPSLTIRWTKISWARSFAAWSVPSDA